ncbi:MAG: acetolactate synthase small subunit [Chitinivibrionales bacterium]|nr:acetolactate synthase small subunit [Chitinivibrionales bacterium]
MVTSNNEQHTISLLVNNKPGVLIRIALVFSRRGYNMESVVVSAGNDPRFSHMSLVASGDRKTLDQIIKQLNKLVDVIHACDHTGDSMIERELALIKVKCPAQKRTEILQIGQHFQCESVDLTEKTITFEATGSSDKLNALHNMLDSYGILETVRSGKLFMIRGSEET